MTPQTPQAPQPPLAGVGIAAVALAALALRLFVVNGYGVFRDELYYAACSQHLAWGYVDHPPLIAAIVFAVRHVLGDSLLALRLLPALASVACIWLTGLTARRLGASAFGQVLAALCAALAPVLMGTEYILSMNAFDHLFWALAIFLAASILAGGRPWLWIALGAVVGLGLLNKYSMGFLALGLAVGFVATPARRLLMRKEPWIGAVLAALLFAPHVAWEIAHGLPTREFILNATLHKNAPLSPLVFIAVSALDVLPLTLPIWLVGLLGLLFARRLAPFRALGFVFPVVLAVFLATHAKTYYLAPAYLLVFAAGGVLVAAWLERGGRRWPRVVALAVLIPGGLAAVPYAIPLLSESAFVRYQKALGIKPPEGERHRPVALPQFYADMHGWENLARTVARVWDGLPEADRHRAAIFCGNYGEAGAIDFFGPRLGLPKAISGHNSYWFWGPRGATGEVVVVVGVAREDLAKTFDEIQQAAVVESEWAMSFETPLPVYVCRRPRASLEAVWPRVKFFI
jgi:hypothetical protein